jgi:hypothetical protein
MWQSDVADGPICDLLARSSRVDAAGGAMSTAAARVTGSVRPGSPFFLGGAPVPPRVLELQKELNTLEKKVRNDAARAAGALLRLRGPLSARARAFRAANAPG